MNTRSSRSIGDESAHHPVPAPEAAERGEPGQLRGQQRQRGVEVRGDEAVELDLVQPRQPIAQPQVALCLPAAGEPFDLGGHRVAVAVDIEAGCRRRNAR